MKCFLLPMLLLLTGGLVAQNTIGFPDIVNYTKQQYEGGGQNWDVEVDARGVMYFANNDGLLCFDGYFWKLFPILNKTRLRSVKADASGRIYVGAQDEFGYFLPDRQGVLRYTSLKSLIPPGENTFADIWDIVTDDGAVFFRSNNKIFEYRNNTVKVYKATLEWRKLCRAGKGIYAQEYKEGLLQFSNGRWVPVCRAFAEQNMLITSILQEPGDTLLITTLKDGIFELYHNQLVRKKTAIDAQLFSQRIYCAIALDDTSLALGTIAKGCYIIRRESGKLVQQFSMEEGLQNNNVLKLFTDKRKNIWLALDNGIDLIRNNTAVKQIYPDKQNLLTSYTARVFDKQLYIGTSAGVYRTPLDGSGDFSFSKNGFSKVPHTDGQVWNLSEVNHQLLLGHHEGIFLIHNNAASPLLRDIGCWLYAPVSSSRADVLAGTYNGLHLMRFRNNSFSYAGKIPGLNESLRFLATDNNNQVWASHPYRGVYRISLQGDTVLHYTLYTAKNGLPSDYDNFVFRLKNRVVVATQKGIYEYDEKSQSFKKSPLLYGILNNTPLQYLVEDSNGNIWFVSNKTPGVIDFHQSSGSLPYSVIYFPELKGKIVSGFECIYPYNEENIFIAAEKGIYHINYRQYMQASLGPAVSISRVRTLGKTDSLIYGGFPAAAHAGTTAREQLVSLPHRYNNFYFEYAAPAADQGSTIEYSYQLQGFDNGWSEWTVKTEKEYTNLPYGYYTFLVKARDNLGNESAVASYAFIIQPAWYQTRVAWLVYLLALSGFVYLLYKRQKRKFANQKLKHEKEQERLISLHQLEVERNEKQLIRVQKEKLEAEVMYKSRELATATMHLVERGKVLSNIREELVEAIRKLEPSVTISSFKRVMRLFEEAENNEEDWEKFAKHFDEVHSGFLLRVKKKFPFLTTTDLRLCAYLHINLTSKEIAQLMGISLRGVETSRYRLRKKLEIPGEVSLNNFLLEAISLPDGTPVKTAARENETAMAGGSFD